MIAEGDNPWQRIPAADYDAHMASPEVGQAQFLSAVLRDLMREHSPKKVLVAGCATGNGFELEELQECEFVAGIDVNPEFVRLARERYGKTLPKLKLICGDIESYELGLATYDLIYAGLLFEYVDIEKTLRNLARALTEDGVIAVVLQLAGEIRAVTPTRWKSLEALADVMTLHFPAKFLELARRSGLRPVHEQEALLPSGKRFHIVKLAKNQNNLI